MKAKNSLTDLYSQSVKAAKKYPRDSFEFKAQEHLVAESWKNFTEAERKELERLGYFARNTIVSTNAVVAKALAIRNMEYSDVFEVGKVYQAPFDKNWVCKVLSRTPTSIRCAIKSVRDKTWHSKDEQVTLRISPAQSREQDGEVAKGYDWEFWASEKVR